MSHRDAGERGIGCHGWAFADDLEAASWLPQPFRVVCGTLSPLICPGFDPVAVRFFPGEPLVVL